MKSGAKVQNFPQTISFPPEKLTNRHEKGAGKAVSSFCDRCKEFLFQPLTNGQVVEFIGSICHEDSEHKDADGYEDVCTQRGILMAISPRHLHVNEGIVSDVDGIRDLTKESVDSQ